MPIKIDTVELEMTLHQESEQQIFVSDDGDEARAIWLPRSMIDVERLARGIVRVTLPAWKAEAEGLV